MSRRTERIGRLIQQEIGRILLTGLSDPRIEPARTSVTRVRVQEDLLRAKVYVSILGSEPQQRLGVGALNHAAGRIQALLRRQVQLRHMPVLEFVADEQFKTALRTWEIIREAMEEIHAKETSGDQAGPAGPAESPRSNEPTPNVQDEP